MSKSISSAAAALPLPQPRAQRGSGGLLASAGWALSMAVADRRNVFRIAVMTVGFALCTFVLLALATISPLVDSMNNRADASLPQLTTGAGSFETLPVSVSLEGRTVSGMVLRAVQPRPPAPPGTSTFPGDGELVVSPALAALLDDPAQRTLRAVVPGEVVGLIDPATLPGAHDLFFYQGSNTLVGGNGSTGWGAPPGDHPLDPRVWSMLITGVIIVMVPLLLFTALAGRIGAARRDRRSATLRLLGASTKLLRLLIAGETLIAATVGVTVAAAAYLAARQLVATWRVGGRGIQPSDLAPGAGWGAAIVVGVPLLAVAATLTGFSTAALTPLAVLSRSSRGARLNWRIALVMAAAAAAVWAQLRHTMYGTDSGEAVVEMCVVVALTLFAVAAMVGVLTDRIARRWSGGSVAGVLGRRRIIQDGPTTTRAAAALATVLAGFVVLMTVLDGTHYADLERHTAGTTDYFGSTPALTVAEWNRLQASLTDVAGSRNAYLTSGLAANANGDKPQVAVATCEAIRLMIAAQRCRDGDSFHVQFAGQPPSPAGPFRLQFANGAAATWTPPATTRQVVVAAATTDQTFLTPTDYLLTPGAAEQQFPGQLAQGIWVQVGVQMPTSAADQVQEAVAWLGWRGYGVRSLSTASDLNSSPVPWIRAGLIGCGVLTLLICALGQALMGAEQISERRRAFALARASGVPLSVLARSVMHAALLPVAVGIVLAASTGALLAPYIQYLRGSIWMPPTWPWILIASAAALFVALAVTAGSTVTLRATTGPGALRTE